MQRCLNLNLLSLIVVWGSIAIPVEPNAATTPPTNRILAQSSASRPASLSALIQKLKSPKASDRTAAAFEIGQMGTTASRATPHLILLLDDPDSGVRDKAVQALGRMGKAANVAIPKLVTLFKTDLEVRGQYVFTLASLGSPTIPHLMPLLKDTDATIRFDVVYTVALIGKSGKAAIPHLKPLLNDPDPGVHSMVAQTLWMIGAPASDFLPTLITLLKESTHSEARSRATFVLKEMGAKTPEVIPALISLLKEPNERVRDEAAQILGELGKPAIPQLIAQLKHPDEAVRGAAAYGLGVMRSAAKSAIPHLTPLLRDPSQKVQLKAREALAKIQRQAPKSR